MGQKTRLMSATYGASVATLGVCGIIATILLGSTISCQRSSDPTTQLLLNIGMPASPRVLEHRDTIRARDIKLTAGQAEDALPQLNALQKLKVIQVLPLFDSTSAVRDCAAYLYSAQERRQGIVTMALFTQSDYGDILILENWSKDRLISWLRSNEDNIGDVVAHDNEKEAIGGVDSWFEFRADSVCKNTVYSVALQYHSGAKYPKNVLDSTSEVYSTSPEGRFILVRRDSVHHESPSWIQGMRVNRESAPQ